MSKSERLPVTYVMSADWSHQERRRRLAEIYRRLLLDDGDGEEKDGPAADRPEERPGG